VTLEVKWPCQHISASVINIGFILAQSIRIEVLFQVLVRKQNQGWGWLM
jgi:hypothetical protein